MEQAEHKTTIMFAPRISEETLTLLRERGGCWAAYVNMALDSSRAGELKFLKVGAGCTFATPPERLPDTSQDIHWAYRYVGMLDLQTGHIEPKE